MTALLLAAGAAGAVSWTLARGLCRPDAPFRPLDRPGPRSLHSAPTPRSGGLAVLAGLAASQAAAAFAGAEAGLPAPVLAAASGLAAVSLLDDLRGLPAGARFLAHLVAAALLVRAGLSADPLAEAGLGALPAWAAAAATILSAAWLVNLYNFMDGSDGLAATMGLAGFGALAWRGWEAGQDRFALDALAAALSCAGFAAFNWAPAKIFLGDAGSTVLGFLAAAMVLRGARLGVVSVWEGLAPFIPFVFDATATVLKRLLRGEKVWAAHSTHAYQRLVKAGWSHDRVALAAGSWMVLLAAGARLLARASPRLQAGAFLAAGALYLVSAELLIKRVRAAGAGGRAGSS